MTDARTNDIEVDVTLFKSASNNSYYPVYFTAPPERGVDELECERLTVDLRPERDVTVYVEIYNPQASIPLIVTPGGMGEIDGFGGFARNVAAAAPDLKVTTRGPRPRCCRIRPSSSRRRSNRFWS